jgi:hypothetical protein
VIRGSREGISRGGVKTGRSDRAEESPRLGGGGGQREQRNKIGHTRGEYGYPESDRI